MKTISLRLETSLVNRIEQDMKEFHYSTKTEFIREAIRAKCSGLEAEREKKLIAEQPAIHEPEKEKSVKGVS